MLKDQVNELESAVETLERRLNNALDKCVEPHKTCARCNEVGHRRDMVQRRHDWYHPECDRAVRRVETCDVCEGKGEVHVKENGS